MLIKMLSPLKIKESVALESPVGEGRSQKRAFLAERRRSWFKFGLWTG